jgi:NAD(P)-dependent dehydrogenase (short-subunit alcohol dehydrogenase family)
MNYPFPVSPSEFNGKRVLVTGGTKGMGALIVERFAASGASVATAARSPLPADQRPALFIQADIGSPEGAGAIIERVNREWDGIDILVNCVGGSDAAYAAAKAALRTYSKGLANEVGPKGVRVNTISPGFIETSGAHGMIMQLAESGGTDEAAARQKIMDMIGGIVGKD